MIAAPDSRPAASYEEAVERVKAFQALDDASIMPEAKSALLDCGARAPVSVVLFHGFTNNPAQYSEFAPMVRACGANVFVPRMPLHGERDRMTASIKNLTAEMLLERASEAVDIAFGLGERVAVLGISMGGALSGYFAQFRPIDTAVPVAPDFSLLQLPYGASVMLSKVGLWFPNIFLWWDPRLKQTLQPHTAYPRFSSHALMQTLRIGDDVYRAAKKQAQLARKIVLLVNRCDPAVNNDVTEDIAKEWCAWKRDGVDYVVMRDLPEWHDIIDPRNKNAPTALVYPRMLKALGLTEA